MKPIQRLTTFLIVCGAVLVASSYFLPQEDQFWSPFLAAQGYQAGGGFLEGPIVLGFETAPAACSLLLIAVLFLRRSPHVASVALTCFLALWLAIAILYAFQFFSLPALKYPGAYALTALIVLAGVTWLCWHRFQQRSRGIPPTLLCVFLASCVFLSQIVSVAFFIFEDGLLLNYGAVTSAVGSAILAVSFLVRHQLHCSLRQDAAF